MSIEFGRSIPYCIIPFFILAQIFSQVILANPLSAQYEIYVAVAMLGSLREGLLEAQGMDEVISLVNNYANQYDVDTIIQASYTAFSTMQQKVTDMELNSFPGFSVHDIEAKHFFEQSSFL
jgi:hypothetical protein